MIEIILVFLFIIAVGAYFVHILLNADQQAKALHAKVKTTDAKPPYRCVIINTGLNTCKAAQARALKPILVDEAPVLPLQSCDSSDCDCRFTKHDDRRLGRRRNYVQATRQIIEDASNRRERKDRRITQYN